MQPIVAESNSFFPHRENSTDYQWAKMVAIGLSYSAFAYFILQKLFPQEITRPLPYWNWIKWSFPIPVLDLIHRITGLFLLQFFSNDPTAEPLNREKKMHSEVLRVEVEGHQIAGELFSCSQGTKRWTLIIGNGNQQGLYKKLYHDTPSHVCIFDLKAVMQNSWFPMTLEFYLKIYRAFLCYIEQQPDVEEIVLHGDGISAAIQSKALSSHTTCQNIRYVMVNRSTFANLGHLLDRVYAIPIFTPLLSIARWSLSPMTLSQNSPIPEIIIQPYRPPPSADAEDCENNRCFYDLKDSRNIVDDGLLKQTESLAYMLLNQALTNKIFLGEYNLHPQSETNILADEIKKLMGNKKG